MPINGDIFIQKVESFIGATEKHTQTTEMLLKRMEDFFKLEDEKFIREKRIEEKRVYVKTKDPLIVISEKIEHSNVLLQDILYTLKGGSSGSKNEENSISNILKKAGTGLAIAGAVAGSESLTNKVLQTALKPILKASSNYFSKVLSKNVIKEGEELLLKKSANVAAKEFIEVGGKKLVINSAGKWVSKETGRFVGKELSEEATNKVAKSVISKSGKGVLRKASLKSAAKIGKFIPGIGFIVATPFAIDRIMKGDYVGAALEVGSAIPGPLGWAIAAGSAARDIWGKSEAQKQAEEGKGWFDPLYNKVTHKVTNKNSSRSFSNSTLNRINTYDSIIDKEAKNNNLDPIMIKAIIAQESRGRKDAVSPVGAEGLMQLMPTTAKSVGVNDSLDPNQNIHGGSKLFRELLTKYGDVEKALAAYNLGESKLNVNIKKYGDDWKAHLPEETRNYIPGVMDYYTEFTKAKLRQGSGVPEVRLSNDLPDMGFSKAISEMADAFTGKGSKGGGVVLSDSTINKLAEKIGKNISSGSSPNIFAIDSRK